MPIRRPAAFHSYRTTIEAEMRDVICGAIRARRLLAFTYDGHRRVVEPHAFGRAANGTLVLRAWQVTGGSVSRHEPPWRLFDVAGITGLRAGAGSFRGPRPDFNPDDPAMETIFCRVEFSAGNGSGGS